MAGRYHIALVGPQRPAALPLRRLPHGTRLSTPSLQLITIVLAKGGAHLPHGGRLLAQLLPDAPARTRRMLGAWRTAKRAARGPYA